ncbi:MAG: DUF4168 domain-containing protein [Pelovirga sp.]
MSTTTKNPVSFFISALFALLVLALAVPAVAQQDYDPNAAAQSQTEEPKLDDETLENFVDAAKQLGEIRNEFAVQLQGVQDENKAREIQEKMNQKMLSAVDEAGIDVPTYNYIANQMNTDQQLRSKVEAMLQ